MNIKNDLFQIISDLFEIGIEDIRENMTANDIEKWDSLQQLNLIMAIENKFNIRMNMDDVFNIRDIKSIIEIISDKLKSQL